MTALDPTPRAPANCFDAEVRAQFAGLGKLELIDAINASYTSLLDRRLDAIPFGNPDTITENVRAAANIGVIRQAQLHRAERLMASSGTMIKERNAYGLALLIRGHFESTAMLGYLCHRVSSYIKRNIAFEKVILDIAHALMGARHEQFAEMPDPVGIMTAFEKADRYYEQENPGGQKGMLADCYAWMSEFAHPNFNSSDSALFLNESLNRFEFRHGADLPIEALDQLGYLAISAEVFLNFLDALDLLAKKAFT